jgi:hypothetical protein
VDVRSEPLADGGSEWTPLIDVTAVPTSELMADGDTALNRSVRRLLDDFDDPNGVPSAFGSFVSS